MSPVITQYKPRKHALLSIWKNLSIFTTDSKSFNHFRLSIIYFVKAFDVKNIKEQMNMFLLIAFVFPSSVANRMQEYTPSSNKKFPNEKFKDLVLQKFEQSI